MGSNVQLLIHYAGKALVRLAAMACFRYRAYGQKNLPAGGALLLSNHQSFLDPPFIGAGATRPMAYMARSTLFSTRLSEALLLALGAFPVKRGAADRDAIREAIRRLEKGTILVMFPEGTRSPDGRLLPMKGGFRLLVRKANVPVIPAAIWGSHKAWPRSKWLPRPRKVRVIYGTPIPPSAFADLSDEQAAELVRAEILALVATLQDLP